TRINTRQNHQQNRQSRRWNMPSMARCQMASNRKLRKKRNNSKQAGYNWKRVDCNLRRVRNNWKRPRRGVQLHRRVPSRAPPQRRSSTSIILRDEQDRHLLFRVCDFARRINGKLRCAGPASVSAKQSSRSKCPRRIEPGASDRARRNYRRGRTSTRLNRRRGKERGNHASRHGEHAGDGGHGSWRHAAWRRVFFGEEKAGQGDAKNFRRNESDVRANKKGGANENRSSRLHLSDASADSIR